MATTLLVYAEATSAPASGARGVRGGVDPEHLRRLIRVPIAVLEKIFEEGAVSRARLDEALKRVRLDEPLSKTNAEHPVLAAFESSPEATVTVLSGSVGILAGPFERLDGSAVAELGVSFKLDALVAALAALAGMPVVDVSTGASEVVSASPAYLLARSTVEADCHGSAIVSFYRVGAGNENFSLGPPGARAANAALKSVKFMQNYGAAPAGIADCFYQDSESPKTLDLAGLLSWCGEIGAAELARIAAEVGTHLSYDGESDRLEVTMPVVVMVADSWALSKKLGAYVKNEFKKRCGIRVWPLKHLAVAPGSVVEAVVPPRELSARQPDPAVAGSSMAEVMEGVRMRWVREIFWPAPRPGVRQVVAEAITPPPRWTPALEEVTDADTGVPLITCEAPSLLDEYVEVVRTVWAASRAARRPASGASRMLVFLQDQPLPSLIDPSVDESPASPEDRDLIQQCWSDEEVADLFRRHSRVVAVRPGYRARDGHLLRGGAHRPVAVVYVARKGLVPSGECRLPRELCGLEVDVREGVVAPATLPAYVPLVESMLSSAAGSDASSFVAFPGASVGHAREHPGTVGAVARAGDQWVALTADHVVHREVGTVPSRVDWRFPALLQPFNVEPVCGFTGDFRAVADNEGDVFVDAALLALPGADRVLLRDGHPATPDLDGEVLEEAQKKGRPEPRRSYRVVAPTRAADLRIGDQFVMFGRTSGPVGFVHRVLLLGVGCFRDSVHAHSFPGTDIERDHAEAQLEEASRRPRPPGRRQMFFALEQGGHMATRGDSGSLVFLLRGNEISPVALVHRELKVAPLDPSGAICTPIQSVLECLAAQPGNPGPLSFLG